MTSVVTLLSKELKDFVSNVYGIGIIILLLVIMYGFLWILPVSSYLSYGIASPELYFQFLAYLFLIVIPLLAIGSLGKEYRFGTLELMRSRGVSWSGIIVAKLLLVAVISLVIMAISSLHLVVVDNLTTTYHLSFTQVLGSYAGLFFVCITYAGVSLAIGAWLQNATLAILLSIIACFILYNGIGFISEADIWSYDTSYLLSTLSLAHHVDGISRGVLQLSSIVYMLSLIIFSVLLSISSLSNKEL